MVVFIMHICYLELFLWNSVWKSRIYLGLFFILLPVLKSFINTVMFYTDVLSTKNIYICCWEEGMRGTHFYVLSFKTYLLSNLACSLDIDKYIQLFSGPI